MIEVESNYDVTVAAIKELELIRMFEKESDMRATPVEGFDPLSALNLATDAVVRWGREHITAETLDILFSALNASKGYWVILLSKVREQGFQATMPLLLAYLNRPYWETTSAPLD